MIKKFFINGLENKNFTMLNRKITPREVTKYAGQFNAISPYPTRAKFRKGYGEIVLELMYKGDPKNLQIETSKLINSLLQADIMFSDFDLVYKCEFNTVGGPERAKGTAKSFILNISLLVKSVESKDWITKTITNTGSLLNSGTEDTPLIITFKTQSDAAQVMFTTIAGGIVISNIKANTSYMVNGATGEMNFPVENYSAYSLPFLRPGSQTVTMYNAQIDATFSWKERYL